MEITILPVWITSIAAIGGTIYTMLRDSRNHSKKNTQLEESVKNSINVINNRLDDPQSGLSAIRKAVDDQKLYCANVSNTLMQMSKANKEEIDRLRGQKSL